MAKVAVKKAVSKSESKTTVLADVKGYARKIYLAGLGAYAKAGKEGADYLKDLVKAGESVEKQGKQLVDEQVEAANSQIDSVKSTVTSNVSVWCLKTTTSPRLYQASIQSKAASDHR